MGMTAMRHRKEDGTEWLLIPLVGLTGQRLDDLASEIGEEPEAVAASMLHDILKDDAEAHAAPGECVRRRSIN